MLTNFIIQTPTMLHYGKLGMHWGVRRKQEKFYGVSKKEVVKKIRVTSFTKDSNISNIRDKHAKALNQELSKAGLIKLLKDSHLEDSNYTVDKKFYGDFDRFQKEATPIRKRVAANFVDEFNVATLKDLNYKDVEKGKQMLLDYGQSYKINSDGVVSNV